MKRYMILRFKKFDDYSAYCFEKSSGDFKHFAILDVFISNSNPADYLDYLQKGAAGFGSNYTGVDWSKKTNSVIIYMNSEMPDAHGEFFAMKFNNFKKMIEDWAALQKKRAPEICFIISDQGSVFVKYNLEEV